MSENLETDMSKGLDNPIVEAWLKNRNVFEGWTAKEWLLYCLKYDVDDPENVAYSWTTGEVEEAARIFTHPVFGKRS